MKYDFTKFRKFLPEELIAAPNHQGTEGYVCPHCGSGTHRGERSTGAVSYYPARDDGTLLWHCKACRSTGDIVDYIAFKKGISKRDAAKYVIQKYADRLESEEATEDHQQEVKPATLAKPKQQIQQEPKSERDPDKQQRQDYSQYIREHLVCPMSMGDRYLQGKRGFKRETIIRFKLGFEWVLYKNKRGAEEWGKGILIPFIDAETGEIPYYITRIIDEDTEARYRNLPKLEARGLPLYHPEGLYSDKPCFIVEGAFDAISVLQAGDEAVALNGIGNGNKLLETLREKPTTSILIVCFDNDVNETTERNAHELTEQLQDMGFKAICNNDICGSYKDANEFLAADPAGFKAAMQAKVESLRCPKIDISASP